MKRPWFNILFYVIWVAIIGFVALKFIFFPIYQSHQWHKQDASYAVTKAFNEYEFALSDRTELNKKVEKAPQHQKAELLQQAPALDKKIADRAKALDKSLDKIKKYYPHNELIEKRIHDLQEWKNQSEKWIMQSTHHNWELTLLGLQIGVKKAIDKAETGYEDPTQAENDKIMALVPKAEEALKKHPNDKKLCTVMQQPFNLLTPNLRLTAQQIAFFNLGDQYCSHYYADPAAWGGWGTKARVIIPSFSLEYPSYPSEKITNEEWNKSHPEEVSLNQKYGSIPYPQYYNQYVLPLIPQAIEVLKNPKKNENICLTGSMSAGPRNPEKDAERAAFVQTGKQYCPPNTLEQGYYATGVVCLMFCDGLCAEGMVCDCVERCKKTPGILFKNNP